MDICGSFPFNMSEWQGTNLNFQTKLKGLLFPVSNDSVIAHFKTSEGLTIEAACMIMLIIAFVLLAIMGSLITACEYFDERKSQENNSTYESKTIVLDDPEQLSKQSESSFKVWMKDIESFLKCFCVVKNGKSILEADPSKEEFSCIQGMRLIGCLWCIIYHTSFFYFLTLRDMTILKPWLESWVAYIFTNSTFFIDVFFVISGFVNAHSFSKDYVKNNGKVSITYFYIKRFVRIAPVYMMVLGFYTTLLSYTWKNSDGLGFTTNQVCQESWWWNLLYINNFRSITQQCMQWCWYLAIDMQFYLVSPIFLVLILRRPNFGYGLTSICIFLSCFASFITTKHCDLSDGFTRLIVNMEDLGPIFYRAALYYEKVYVMPHTRIHSYLIGILLGIYIYKRRNGGKESKQNWVILSCGWILSIILMLAPVFALYNIKDSTIEMAIYNGLKHLSFSVGFSWIVLVCVTGQGGFVNRTLSCKTFFPFSKLSYCAYLIHMVILMRFYQTATQLQDFSILNLTRLYLFIYLWTFFFAFFASLLIEFPMKNVLGIFRNKNMSEKSKL